jgi:hypothetical protein
MIFLGMRELVRRLDEVVHVEGDEHAPLAPRFAQQVVVTQVLQ